MPQQRLCVCVCVCVFCITSHLCPPFQACCYIFNMLPTLHIDPSLSKEGRTHTCTHTWIDMHFVSHLGHKRKCHLGPTRRQTISKNLWHDYRYPEELQLRCATPSVGLCAFEKERERERENERKMSERNKNSQSQKVKERISVYREKTMNRWNACNKSRRYPFIISTCFFLFSL